MTQTCGVVDTPQGHALIWRDPDRTKKMGWEETHEGQQAEVQSPAPGEQHPQIPTRAGGTQLERSLGEKPWGSWWIQHHMLLATHQALKQPASSGTRAIKTYL